MTKNKPVAKADSFKGDKRKLDEVIKGMDKVRQQRVKIVKHYIKNNKYGFTTTDEEAKSEQDEKVS